MEAAALFAVASVRKVKAAAVFTVSDILGEEEWSGFIGYEQGYKTLAQIAKLFKEL
jgi:purine-nucleoside phosphorylase